MLGGWFKRKFFQGLTQRTVDDDDEDEGVVAQDRSTHKHQQCDDSQPETNREP